MPRTDTASRIIKASPQAIYDAFVDPVALAAWLPPKGMKGAFEHFEPRPGGRYRMTLTYEAPDPATPGKTAPMPIWSEENSSSSCPASASSSRRTSSPTIPPSPAR